MQHNSPRLKRRYNGHIIAMLLFVLVPFSYAADSALKPLNVLILSPSANPWNEQTTDGLLSHMGKQGPHIVLHREILNPLGRRGVPALTVKQLNARYANANIDYVVVTTPTEGMQPYLKKAGNQLLPNAIKIYEAKSGRTFKATQSSDVPNTLIVERPSLIDQALEQALQLHQPKQLYLFANPQSNGYLDKTLLAAVEALKQKGTLTAQVNHMPLMSTQGYINYLRAQPAKDGMVFFTAEFNDANGPVVPAVMINTIAAGIDMPVVPYFGSMMTGNGALGGLLQNPFTYGELLADVVLEHQNGRLFDYDTYRANHSEEERANYPVIPMHQNIFDDAQLHRLGIAHRKLPNNAIIINEQNDYFIPGNYVTEILVISLLVAVLLIAGMRVVIVARTASLRRAEQEAQAAAQVEEFKRYLDAAPIPVGILDGDRNSRQYTYVNQAMCEKFGYAFEELIGLNATQAMFVHDSDRTAFNQLVWDSIDKQTTFVMEAPLYLKGKEVKYFELAGRYTQEGDRLLGTLFYFDITERIQYDQAQKDLLESERKLVQSRRLEAIGNLLAGMAHSLNNHMQPILVLAGLLRRKVGEDPKAQDYLAKMEEAVTGATSILQRALTASRSEKLSQRAKIKSSFTAAVELAAIGIPSTITYSHQVSLAEDGYVSLDKVNLEVCLLNLIHNARDAIDEAHGEIRVSLSRLTPDAERVESPDLLSLDWIAIKVEDSGSGMNDEQLARALDPFYTTKDPGKGTGLGLSETYSLVMQAHGYLTVSSVPHEGTSVALCLPVYPDASN